MLNTRRYDKKHKRYLLNSLDDGDTHHNADFLCQSTYSKATKISQKTQISMKTLIIPQRH